MSGEHYGEFEYPACIRTFKPQSVYKKKESAFVDE